MRIYSILLLIGLYLPAFAQSHIGVQGGYTTLNFTGSDLGDHKAIGGVTAGGYYDINLWNGIAVRPGLSFTQKGGQMRYEGEALDLGVSHYSAQIDYHLWYLDMPLLLAYHPLKGYVQPEIVIGPTVGVRLSGMDESLTTGLLTSFGEKTYTEITPYNLDLTVGAGVCIYQATLDFRYNIGLNSIDNRIPDKSDHIFFRSAQFLLGYRF
jgi:hypothetical protein